MDPALAPPLCLRASIIFAFARLFEKEGTSERIKRSRGQYDRNRER